MYLLLYTGIWNYMQFQNKCSCTHSLIKVDILCEKLTSAKV